jgi:MFS family permease
MNYASYKSIVLSSIFGIIHSVAFVSSVFSAIINQNISDPLMIASILAIKRFSRIFLDIPAGIFGDKFGSKILFILSMLSILLSMSVLLISKTIIVLFISVILKGLSDSCSAGKVEAHIYNILKYNNNFDQFGKIISTYYLFMDLTVGFAVLILSVYLINVDQFLIYGIILSICGLVMSMFIKDNYIMNNIKRPTFKEIFRGIKAMYRSKSIFLLMLLWGLCNFLGWQLHSITTILLAHFNFTINEIVRVQSMEHFALVAGCIVSFIISDKISFKKIMYLFIFSILIMCICAILYTPFMIITSVLFYLCCFCTLQIFFEKIIDKLSAEQSRLSINSATTTITAIYNSIGMVLFGFLAKYYGYKTSWNIICFLFLLYIIIVYFFIKYKKLTF